MYKIEKDFAHNKKDFINNNFKLDIGALYDCNMYYKYHNSMQMFFI